MQQLTNEAVLELVNNGMISIIRLNHLIYLKEFVDRIASKHYLEEFDVKKIKKKYGVMPNVVTWGDYFQTEMATSLINVTDDEFIKAFETVKFDMISSYQIFSEKDTHFFEWIDESREKIEQTGAVELTEEDEEIIHLHILKDYYLNLGIQDFFTDEEIHWYNSFKEAMAI